jgi:GPI-anchor transamidase subunit GAA1
MESSAKQEKQPKPRLIVRLGLFLASHHIFFRFAINFFPLAAVFSAYFLVPLTHSSPFGVSVICCCAGIVALFLLPSLAKNTYLSENALIPGK